MSDTQTSKTVDNPWREFIENVIAGKNYFRASEYRKLIADLDRLYALEERAAPETSVIPTGMDTPWPLHDVLAKLIAATEHLLDHHACDTHGHEEFRTAANRGKELLASQVKTGAPHPYLCNATRFKLSFDSKGRTDCFWSYEKELDGRWVALVSAEDDSHMRGYSLEKTTVEPPYRLRTFWSPDRKYVVTVHATPDYLTLQSDNGVEWEAVGAERDARKLAAPDVKAGRP